MKSKTAKISLFCALAAALVVGVAFAQTEGTAESGPTQHHGMKGMHGEFMGGHGMGFPMRELNLTEDQHAQIKQLFQNEKGNIHPLMQQEFQAHQQMMQLVTSGNFDHQMQVEHAKIASQIYQLLSSDQKAKVADIMAKHQQRMQEHMQKGTPADNQ